MDKSYGEEIILSSSDTKVSLVLFFKCELSALSSEDSLLYQISKVQLFKNKI